MASRSKKKNSPPAKARAKKSTPRKKDLPRFPIVALGASAGGLEAFETFFKAMEPASGMAFVLVAHLDPTHVSLLPELIQKHTKMEVHQVVDGMHVQRNHVYIIPPNKSLTILNGTLQLMELEEPRGRNLPIDSFFRALAKDQGANAVCIILSGTGTDGTLGLKAIKGEVGMVMVQDAASAKYDGIPRSAIASGLADFVLPPEKMPEQLINYTLHAAQNTGKDFHPPTDDMPNALQKIYVILRARTDHDFSLYKRNTICRRIERRMSVHQIDEISDYVRYLQGSEREAEILFKELLIGVTNFFRDPEAFERLETDLIIQQLREKPDDYTVRVWIAGCSSGEEAYSIAIILHECIRQMNRHFNVQIFGTDIDEDAIQVAGAGVYPESIQADVSPERLKRHFTKQDDGHYRIKKSIREMLVFAPQNLIKDPPFTKLDMLSCRNLLIYLTPELQKKLLPIFHYSLRSDGILFLGSSETIGQATDFFSVLDKKWKIFKRADTGPTTHPTLDTHPVSRHTPQVDELPAGIRRAEEISALQLVETILQQSTMPPCAIIDDACNVIYIHGRIGRYLEPAEGRISVNILEMSRAGLKGQLASAIRKVAKHKQEVLLRNLLVDDREGALRVNVAVRPVPAQTAMHGLMMVVFEECTTATASVNASADTQKKKSRKSVETLEQELQHTRENLQTTIEELETTNEELNSTNEELQSTNEELQSTNEEMETSKEELQSLNEESITVNVELQSRIEDLSTVNDDMKNLLDSSDIATLFLDTDLCVRRFTPKATSILPLALTDIGRPIKHFTTSLVDTNLSVYGGKVLDDLLGRDIEATSEQGLVYAIKFRPYRTSNNVIDGVVITFEEITERINIRTALEESESKFRTLVEASIDWIWETDAQGTYTYAGPQVEGLLGYTVDEVIGKTSFDFMSADEATRVAKLFKEAAAQGKPLKDLKYLGVHKDGSSIQLETRGMPVLDDAKNLIGYRGVHRNISGQNYPGSEK